MPLIHESAVFKLTYDTLKEIHLARNTFSKSERYSLGESLEREVLAILLHILDAGRARQEWKIAAIDAALVNLDKSKILLRLARDLGQIRDRPYAALAEKMNTTGRMLGGWRKSV